MSCLAASQSAALITHKGQSISLDLAQKHFFWALQFCSLKLLGLPGLPQCYGMVGPDVDR